MQSINITFAEIFGYCRDLSIAGAIVTFVWKVRGTWDEIQSFTQRVLLHMDRVEHTMDVIVANHLTHISQALEQLAKTNGSQVPTDHEHR